ncbi:MAG TPA: DUF2269 family protein [Gaiellaceae bacterium]|nr:DUF2269 family protein [Gaiellaceae bacterium]
MTKYDWLLLFHLLGAFLFVSGAVVAGILHFAATRREQPSEVALLLRLTQPAVALVAVGSLATLALGIWLAEYVGYGIGEGWVVAAIVLWAVSGALAGPAGKILRRARELAERLAQADDRPSTELRRAVTDRRAIVLNSLSFAALIAILVLMVWKP